MNIDLAPDLDRFVADQVLSGRFPSAAAVVTQALKMLRNSDEFDDEAMVAEMNAMIETARAEADRGEVYTPEEVRAWLKARHDPA